MGTGTAEYNSTDKSVMQFDTIAVGWDDVSLERKSQLMPEELREDFMFLGAYGRSECDRDVDVLVAKLKALGIDHDRTNWVKILKGRWQLNAKGQRLASPVIKAENFRAAIEALRNNIRIEQVRGRIPFVETSTYLSIKNYILTRCRPEWVNKFGVIVGPTGGQKTASYKEIVRMRNHGLSTWYEAPENGSLGELITKLAVNYGCSARLSLARKRAHVFESFNPKKLIIIDNCQELFRERYGAEQPAFSFLRRLQDECGGTIILSITPSFMDTLQSGMLQGYFEQFEGRSGGRNSWLRLPTWSPDQDVIAIGKAFKLEDAARHVKTLKQIAQEPGRIRILFETLQKAKILAEAEEEPLTIDHLTTIWQPVKSAKAA